MGVLTPALNFTSGQRCLIRVDLKIKLEGNFFLKDHGKRSRSSMVIYFPYDNILINGDRIKLCFNEPYNEMFNLTKIDTHHFGWIAMTMIVTDPIQ